MKKAIVLVLALFVFAVPAFAQCPNAIGQWSTQTGTMLGGRASEAWCGAGGYPVMGGVPGNTQDAQSWDGSTLGTQWRAWGMEIDANGAVLVSDNVVGGNGSRTYNTYYDNGQFWLSQNYSWADGLADLSGNLNNYQVVTTISYVGGTAVGAVSNIYFTGSFANCAIANNCQIDFTIANAILAWNPQMGPILTGYPAFLCGATTGELFDVCCITTQINCTVNKEDETWGSLKAQYR